MAASTLNLKEIDKMISALTDSEKQMPALFIGHGSPMNAIEENEFTRSWSQIGNSMPKPSAILCISAHWETRGTFVTTAEHPATIHDFYGFPDTLFSVQYPAPGNPILAKEIIEMAPSPPVRPDSNWGMDHGTWSVLKHFYPEANIPVLQLSLDHSMKPEDHYLLAKKLNTLRRKGVLIIGSGNMVHNLRQIDWRNPGQGFEWAEQANELFKNLIVARDFQKLIHYDLLGKAVQLSVPTPEHYLPLLYILAQTEESDTISFFNDHCIYGSLAMTSVQITNQT